jgi:hypothetical protein
MAGITAASPAGTTIIAGEHVAEPLPTLSQDEHPVNGPEEPERKVTHEGLPVVHGFLSPHG